MSEYGLLVLTYLAKGALLRMLIPVNNYGRILHKGYCPRVRQLADSTSRPRNVFLPKIQLFCEQLSQGLYQL